MCVCMYVRRMHMYVCMYVCMYVRTHAYVCMYVYACVYVCLWFVLQVARNAECYVLTCCDLFGGRVVH